MLQQFQLGLLMINKSIHFSLFILVSINSYAQYSELPSKAGTCHINLFFEGKCTHELSAMNSYSKENDLPIGCLNLISLYALRDE